MYGTYYFMYSITAQQVQIPAQSTNDSLEVFVED